MEAVPRVQWVFLPDLVESAVSIFTDKETEAQKENVIRARYFRL
jgi:hypothetical protein